MSFSVYTIILDKRALPQNVIEAKSRLYHYLARRLIDAVPLDQAESRIVITLDRSKGLLDIAEFNRSLLAQLEGTVAPNVPIEIFHADSSAIKGLQAVDMLASAIFHKYEWGNSEWYDYFFGKVMSEEVYRGHPPIKKE